MGLSCIVVGDGGTELCLTQSTSNMACGPARQCPDGDTCYLTDLAFTVPAYLVTGMLSEQILTFTSVGHFWMSLGYAVTLAHDAEPLDAVAS